MSITAGWIALAVMLLRLPLKKAPKWIMGVLWAFVALRLVLPISFESVLSLIPSTQTLPQNFTHSPAPVINSGIPMLNSTINPVISQSLAPAPDASANPTQNKLYSLGDMDNRHGLHDFVYADKLYCA